MPFGGRAHLYVRTDATDDRPAIWAWAVYGGSDRFLILRSRPACAVCSEALAAGLEAVKDIGRRLGTEVAAVEDAQSVREHA
jgi:hypothetical protein